MTGMCDILVIDDDLATRTFMAEALSSEGYTVQCCSWRQVTVESIKRGRARLLILELRQTDPETGLLHLDQLRRWAATREMEVLASCTDARLLEELAEPLRHLRCEMLLKPFDLEDFLDCVAQALCSGRSCEERVRPREICAGNMNARKER